MKGMSFLVINSFCCTLLFFGLVGKTLQGMRRIDLIDSLLQKTLSWTTTYKCVYDCMKYIYFSIIIHLNFDLITDQKIKKNPAHISTTNLVGMLASLNLQIVTKI